MDKNIRLCICRFGKYLSVIVDLKHCFLSVSQEKSWLSTFAINYATDNVGYKLRINLQLCLRLCGNTNRMLMGCTTKNKTIFLF